MAKKNSAARNKPPFAWYSLRRTLPTWSFEQNLAELVEYLPRYGVDEVIIKVDTEEFTHGQPLLGWVEAYLPRLFRIREAMDKLGIRYSLNPWITVGHCDRGRDSRRELPNLRTMVGHEGTECTCCACPTDPVWRAHEDRIWTLYAQTQPHVMWVEDDIRTFNHEPIKFGCFCPLHMKRFSQRVGKKVSRDQLVGAILAPGTPHPWRKEYMDMQAEIMIDTVRFLGQVVHRTSPATALGLMSSGPRNHALEGRRWEPFALAMADGQSVYSRPPMGNYSEGPLRGFYYSHDSIKATRYCMPKGTVEQTEVESVPFTEYSKSVVFTFLEMAVSFAYGSHGVTMNLFDHSGTPMQNDPGLGRMLARKKPFLNGLAQFAQQPGSYRGVRLLHHQKASYVKQLPAAAPYGALAADGNEIPDMLETLGIATTYEESGVIATQGQHIRAFGDAEIRQMLRGGLLLDGEAAGVLVERGFGKHIGLKSVQPPKYLRSLGALSSEEFFNPLFGGQPRKFMTATLPDLFDRSNFCVMVPLAKAQIISQLVDPDLNPVYPAMTAFENSLGGRVVVHAFEQRSAFGVHFCHPHRLEQMQGAVRWLARNEAPLLVRGGGVYPLAFRKDLASGQTLLGMFNLSLDPWDGVEFELARDAKVKSLKVLDHDGRWVARHGLSSQRRNGTTVVRFFGSVPFDQPLFVLVG